MFKRIPTEIKEEILSKVKEGKYKVPELAEQYGISEKTIYHWIRMKAENSDISLIQVNRLKRENDELKRIIGIIALQLEREKKGKRGPLG